MRHLLGRDIQTLRCLSRNVQFGGMLPSKRHRSHVLAGNQRRVHESLQWDALEHNGVIRFFAIEWERALILPTCGQADTRDEWIAIVRQVWRIQNNFPPIDYQLVIGTTDGGLKSFRPNNASKIQVGLDFTYAARDINMEQENVEVVAMPRDRLSICREYQPDHLT